jgi:hypothetical protein
MGEYLDEDTQHKTAGCYNGKLYYLTYPSGYAEDCNGGDGGAVTCRDNNFVAPPGSTPSTSGASAASRCPT